MTVVVLASRCSASSDALICALEAGFGRVRRVADEAAGRAALPAASPAILVLDLRGDRGRLRAHAGALRAAFPLVRSLALVDRPGDAPDGCDAALVSPFYLEEVVRWCGRAGTAPLSSGLLSDLATGLGHEIGNPLTSLFLQLELLKADGRSEGLAEHLALIEESARRIQSVVRDVADAAARRPVTASPSAASSLLAETASRLRSRAPELAGRLAVRCEETEIPVDADLVSMALADVWEYLLRAGYREDRLAVEGRRDGGGRYCIRHQARTPRLPPDAAGRLFTPLWARQALGLSEGLSLTSARNVFLRHGGDLRARSRPAGELVLEALLPHEAQARLGFPA